MQVNRPLYVGFTDQVSWVSYASDMTRGKPAAGVDTQARPTMGRGCLPALGGPYAMGLH